MNLLETIMSAQSGNLVEKIAESNGIDVNDTLKALGGLIPGITSQLRTNSADQNGLESLLRALQTGNHNQYLDDTQSVSAPTARLDGNQILGHILGSKDASRNLASQVADQTGLDSNLLKKLLPVVATLIMGALSKQGQAGGVLEQLLGTTGGNTQAASPLQQPQSILNSFLDMNNDGSVVDDVMRLAGKYLFR